MNWLRRLISSSPRVDSMRNKIENGKLEIEQDKREIAETKPIVEEAVKRTNKSFREVEKNTSRAKLEMALIRDLDDGGKRLHG